MSRNLKLLFSAGLFSILFSACEKRFAEPTYAPNATAVKIWYRSDPFYYPRAEIFLESTGTWRIFISFPVIYDNDPNKLGFANPWVAGRGTNALYMNTLYANVPGGLTSDSGFYNVTIAKCFEFLPDKPGDTKGVVNVIPQNVRLYRRDKSFFEIPISGTGRYDEEAKLFEVEVLFDETEIGGPKEIRRRYRYQP